MVIASGVDPVTKKGYATIPRRLLNEIVVCQLKNNLYFHNEDYHFY